MGRRRDEETHRQAPYIPNTPCEQQDRRRQSFCVDDDDDPLCVNVRAAKVCALLMVVSGGNAKRTKVRGGRQEVQAVKWE